jgi:Zn-dependent peptidase ImmA (M78 family)
MSDFSRKTPAAGGSSGNSSRGGEGARFQSPLALGLCAALPSAKDPVDAITWHARTLVLEAGLSKPPFRPASFAHLRKVTAIVQRDMRVEGRLLPCEDGFVIELRRDRPYERKNFTCAHELAHTFFYEAVPTVKYRAVSSPATHHDPEEEMLCNIAAAEMLMPLPVFSKVAADYHESPQSLVGLARLFETSVTATVIRLHRLRTWAGTYILWRQTSDGLVANWMAQPKRGLTYYPSLKIVNPEASSIRHTLQHGEATSADEILVLGDGYKPCRIHSFRLEGSNNVLSCFGIPGAKVSPAREESQLLPLDYTCECDGTGWRTIRKDGRNYVARCRAARHVRKHSYAPEDHRRGPAESTGTDHPLFTKIQ